MYKRTFYAFNKDKMHFFELISAQKTQIGTEEIDRYRYMIEIRVYSNHWLINMCSFIRPVVFNLNLNLVVRQ